MFCVLQFDYTSLLVISIFELFSHIAMKADLKAFSGYLLLVDIVKLLFFELSMYAALSEINL